LIAAPAAPGTCEWVSTDPREPLARCSQVEVTAKRTHTRLHLAAE
jgi:hypothetical protein